MNEIMKIDDFATDVAIQFNSTQNAIKTEYNTFVSINDMPVNELSQAMFRRVKSYGLPADIKGLFYTGVFDKKSGKNLELSYHGYRYLYRKAGIDVTAHLIYDEQEVNPVYNDDNILTDVIVKHKSLFNDPENAIGGIAIVKFANGVIKFQTYTKKQILQSKNASKMKTGWDRYPEKFMIKTIYRKVFYDVILDYNVVADNPHLSTLSTAVKDDDKENYSIDLKNKSSSNLQGQFVTDVTNSGDIFDLPAEMVNAEVIPPEMENQDDS